MRRASFTPSFKVSVDEPLIVVDESEELEGEQPTSPKSLNEEDVDDDKDSPDNPYLLSPFRDPRETRKHSLPNIQCTSGIMASQVRRLSDGGENAPSTSEVAFLAQLSQVILCVRVRVLAFVRKHHQQMIIIYIDMCACVRALLFLLLRLLMTFCHWLKVSVIFNCNDNCYYCCFSSFCAWVC